MKFKADHPVVLWLLRHAAWAHQRFNPYKAGASAYARLTGSAYNSKIPGFGEQVYAMIPAEKGSGGAYRTAKLATRWVEGTWLGKSERSDEHLIAVSDDKVVRVRTLRR